MSKLIQIAGIASTFVVLYGCTTTPPVVIQQPAPTIVVPSAPEPYYEPGPDGYVPPNDTYNEGPGPNDSYEGPGGPGPNDSY